MFRSGSVCRSFKRRVAERGYVSAPEIFGTCRSEVVESPGIVCVLELWADLHKFEGLGHGSFERLWLRVGARAAVFGLEIFRFCRS